MSSDGGKLTSASEASDVSVIMTFLIGKPLKGSPLRAFEHKYYIQNIK